MPPEIVAQWYVTHNSALRRSLSRFNRLKSHEVDDVLTNVWIRVLRLVDEADVQKPFQFLQHLAINEVANYKSHSCRRRTHLDVNDMGGFGDTMGLPEQLIEWRDGWFYVAQSNLVDGVQLAIELLSPRQRDALLLHYFEEMTYEAIGRKRGLSYRQVLRDLTGAYSLLRMQLSPMSSESDHQCQRNHAQPAPGHAAGHLERLHQKQDDRGNQADEVDGIHGTQTVVS